MDDEALLSTAHVASYLGSYAETYREAYKRFTAPPPSGGGYPAISPSPYLSGGNLLCRIAADGYSISVVGDDPGPNWHFMGGPAFLSDTEPTRTPPEVARLILEKKGHDDHIGIMRVVSEDPPPLEVWTGSFPEPLERTELVSGPLQIDVRRYDLSLLDLAKRATFGAIGSAVKYQFPNSDSPFWNQSRFRRMGFATADRKHHTFFDLLEFSPHVSRAAWDERSIPTRVSADIRSDFADALELLARGGGGLFNAPGGALMEQFDPPGSPDRLDSYIKALDGLEALLNDRPDDHEVVFQDYIAANPAVLDVYGTVTPQPRFNYPDGSVSPIGKAYVEPDFVVAYPDGRYRLVEIERPHKPIATKQGQPRAEVTQAAFQIAEWIHYLEHHSPLVADRFPGMSATAQRTLVIGRDSSPRPNDGPLADYLALLRNQYNVDEVLTYDSLLTKGRTAVTQIAGASVQAEDSSPPQSTG